MNPYIRHSRSAYYAVITAIPLLLAYEMLLAFTGSGLGGQVRNAGDVWLRMLFASLDVRPAHATLAMILLLILSVPVVKRDDLGLHAGYFALMALEALVYSLGLGLAINVILEFVFSAIPSSILQRVALSVGGLSAGGLSVEGLSAGGLSDNGVMQGLALSLGAGLFEEFIFRVLLLGLLLAGARVILPKQVAGVLSVILAAFLFSLAHYIGPLGDDFTFGSFMFRFVAGLLFTGLYHLRGFAIVAYSHALYDIRVILF